MREIQFGEIRCNASIQVNLNINQLDSKLDQGQRRDLFSEFNFINSLVSLSRFIIDE